MHRVEQLDPRQDQDHEPIVARRRPRPPAFVVDGLVTVERGHRGRVGPPVGTVVAETATQTAVVGVLGSPPGF